MKWGSFSFDLRIDFLIINPKKVIFVFDLEYAHLQKEILIF